MAALLLVSFPSAAQVAAATGQSRLPTNTILSCAPKPIGQTQTCSVTVEGSGPSTANLTGSVSFSYASGISNGGAVSFSSPFCSLEPPGGPGPTGGTASCLENVTITSTGNVQLKAEYSGDGDYLPSSQTLTWPSYRSPSFIVAREVSVATADTGGLGFQLGDGLVACRFDSFDSPSGCEVSVSANPATSVGSLSMPYPSGTMDISAVGVGFSSSSCDLAGTSGLEYCLFTNSTDVSNGASVTFDYSGDSHYYPSALTIEGIRPGGFYEANNGALECGGQSDSAAFDGISVGISSQCANLSGLPSNAPFTYIQSSNDGGAITIGDPSGSQGACSQREFCEVEGLSPGTVTVETNYTLGSATVTYPVLPPIPYLRAYCDASRVNSSGINCAAFLSASPIFQDLALSSATSYPITWETNSTSGTLDPSTCDASLNTIYTDISCAIDFRDSASGVAEVTATYQGSDGLSSSATIDVSTPLQANPPGPPSGVPEFPFQSMSVPIFVGVIVFSYLFFRRRS